MTESAAAAEPLLSIRDLSLAYRTERGLCQALRGVCLDIPRASIIGLVGESGCGKSTLIAAIIGLLAANARAHSGVIEFQRRNLLQLSAPEMRAIRGRRIAVVFQDPMSVLHPALTIGRQMLDIQYRERRRRGEKIQHSLRLLASVGIPDPARCIKQFPHELSGGMKQRIAIAMALQARPALLIADEPSTALDATLEVQIMRLLRARQADLGCSVLFISHHLGAVAELCDQVAVMYAGEIIEHGATREVFHHPAHPYTQKLLQCDPANIADKTRELPTIAGEIPDLIDLKSGCIFANRCQHRLPKCATTPPAMQRRGSHRVSCHLAWQHPASAPASPSAPST